MIDPFLLLLAQAAAQPQPPSAGPQPVIRRHAAPKPVVTGDRSCIPMDVSAVLPVVPARIGNRDVQLGFDTGAPGPAHVKQAVLDSLGLDRIGEARVSDPSGRNPLTVGIYGLPEMQLGSLKIAGSNATVHTTSRRSMAQLDGIIGLGAFDGYVVTMDYPGGRLLIEKGRLPEPDERTSFRYEGPIPRVPLTIEGQAIEAHLDSGNARYPIILPASFAAKLQGYSKRFAVGVARTVSNSFNLMALPIGDAKAGEFPLYAGTAAFPSPANRGNIGSMLLRDMIVKIDPANSIVSLEHASGQLENGCPAT